MAQADGVPLPDAAPSRVSKLVLLGSGSVGKSSLVLRYVKGDFKSVLPTVGCAFFTKVVAVGNVALKLEIWDTAGQEKYHSVCHLYFRGAQVAMLVYDVTRKEGKEFAESRGLLFMETSARLNHQVSEIFSAVAQELLQRDMARLGSSPLGNSGAMRLNQAPTRRTKCCSH
ncbi:ras-related protein Rab-17 isoform X3 [Cavia porcellus]|uniref:ras-related protein Rab-17 isoform X3 n=1 Tax=Cavia porcellus TaxID=10141 RepID=UPI002FE300C0